MALQNLFGELAESFKKNDLNLNFQFLPYEWKFPPVIKGLKEYHLLFTSVEVRVIEDRVTYCMIAAESCSLELFITFAQDLYLTFGNEF